MKITPIRTNEDYERTLRRIEEIFDAKPGTDEGDELEVLSILVDEYERKEFPIDLPTPLEALKFRMDQLGMEQKDLAKLLGSRSHTSEILSGKRPLSLNHMRILYRELGIPAEVFIRAETEPEPEKKLTLLEGLARGEKAILEGRIVTHAEAKKRMARWLE